MKHQNHIDPASRSHETAHSSTQPIMLETRSNGGLAREIVQCPA
jgi:hypothetical protein